MLGWLLCLLRLLSNEVEHDLSAMRMGAVLEEIDALPGSQNEVAVHHGDGELHLR